VSPESKQWIEAAKILATDPAATFPCPECKKGNLRVTKDEPLRDNKIDRWIVCDCCNAYNILLMEKPAKG
jgi:transposase-like protein